jgi:hypothetical protein
LTVKASLIFEKRFTIFKINRFPKLSSLSLHACFIFNRQNLAIVGRRDPVGAGVRQHPVAGNLPVLESGHRQTKLRLEICRIPAKLAGSLIFAFHNFFKRTKHRKIFSRKSFFLKMISSKQTEHMGKMCKKWKLFKNFLCFLGFCV